MPAYTINGVEFLGTTTVSGAADGISASSFFDGVLPGGALGKGTIRGVGGGPIAFGTVALSATMEENTLNPRRNARAMAAYSRINGALEGYDGCGLIEDLVRSGAAWVVAAGAGVATIVVLGGRRGLAKSDCKIVD